jgi:OOP family OmpA-OmpF porin
MKVTSKILVLILIVVFAGCSAMSKRTKCIGTSALAGAAIGAGAGAAVGNQGENDSGEGAAVGTAAGAIIGGAVGLVICKSDEDSDGDGVPDSLDKCPNTPIGVEVDAKGCPLDTDGDGVPDYLDKCPNTPKGVQVDAKGCPLDSDGDGVIDSKDKCPDTPKGVKVDKNGCPLDSDGDGVPDYMDKCPQTPKGSKVDAKGCPIVGEKLLILRGINFAFDSAAISQDSKGVLAVAVTTLKDNPKVKVRIEGHTDSTGPEEYNLGLSQRRSQGVKDYLIAQGVAAERLSVEGKGESVPVATNGTKEGRAKNRRVEFIVTAR